MNLAILVLDFESYMLEGGNLSRYPLCNGCDTDSLPFEVNFRDTWDLASIVFRYAGVADTLFAASIIWMGRGEIHYPTAWTRPDTFCDLPAEITQPSAVQRFQFYPRLPREKLIAKTDSAWAAISSLDIVHAFAKDSFRVGYYFYPPTVGMFDPTVAKWIVFLYRGNSR